MSPEANKVSEDTMTCEEFQAMLPELFEKGIDAGAQPHLQQCENCAELVRDLEYIAQQAKLLLPMHDPSPAVWDRVQSSIENSEREASDRH